MPPLFKDMLSLLFAEYGVHVHFYDPSESSVKRLLKNSENAELNGKLTQHDNYESLAKALGSPKTFMLSTPHGTVADKTIQGLRPFLAKGDILIDAANENWVETERRQRELEPLGIHYIGMGVSGGYQSARAGPSMCPGGNDEALDLIMPFLQKIAAKDKNGRPCVAKIGPGSSGHYVKMVHNGIEQGMMSALCEAWAVMNQGLSMTYEEIADVFDRWNREDGRLQDNFLIAIGSRICRTRDPSSGEYVLATVRDKVVQDADDSEGTGIWSCEEATRLHVPIPTIASAHLFRIASADAAKREAARRSFKSQPKPGKIDADKNEFLGALYTSLYLAFLSCFVQGFHILAKTNDENRWGLNFRAILQVWRSGCIIRSNAIVDMLDEVFQSENLDANNLLSHPKIGVEMTAAFPALKKVVLRSVEADLNVPSLSATLEYYKYSGCTDLPTSFQEAELDYFGEHMFDLKTEEPGKPVTGSHHFEWQPARGILQDG
ncbi:hypothetical protein VTK73DRAFT_6251 [Phialemonium thermophilum]|uniref:6-phosphogluconate dehydrogenase, decarboxylating n=1 Tax=Phialemonium thermophilum TaxID=223376 RepID=A0ABR3WKJ7_9PEZI